MSAGRFARQNELHRRIQRCRRPDPGRIVGIQEHQHAPLGFCGRHQFSGSQKLRPHVLPSPETRNFALRRLARQRAAEHGPQRTHLQLGQLGIVFLPPRFDLAGHRRISHSRWRDHGSPTRARAARCEFLQVPSIRFGHVRPLNSSPSHSACTRAMKSPRISALLRCLTPHLRNSSLFFDWLCPKNGRITANSR